MAAINGSLGSVSFGAGTQYDNNVISFDLNYTENVIETTAYGSTARTFIGGDITTWSGTFTALIDDTTAISGIGTAAATLTLTATTSRTYAGSAIITSMAVSHAFDGRPQVVCTFQGTGALTIA